MTRIHCATWRDGIQQIGLEATNIGDVRAAIQAVDPFVHIHELGFAIHSGGAEKIRMGLDMNLRGKVAAFGRTHERDVEAILKLQVPVGVLVGKSRTRDAEHALRMSPKENLKLIERSVRILAEESAEVIYDAEHAFDGLENGDTEYTLETLRVAREAGASCLVLCDTTGGMMPEQIAHWTQKIAEIFPGTRIGFHGHDDCGLGVVNAQVAFTNGAQDIQGTFLGSGERCSNTNLTTLIPNLVLKLGQEIIPRKTLRNFTPAMHVVAKALGIEVPTHHPWVGKYAFSTSAGMHASGATRDHGSYWHIAPEEVGNKEYTALDEQSGTTNVLARAMELGIKIPKERASEVMHAYTKLTTRGVNFGLADASFELFLRRQLQGESTNLTFERFRLHIEHQSDGKIETEASLRMQIADEPDPKKLHNADGDGPVNALEKVLKRTLLSRHPVVEQVEIADYRVTMLEMHQGSASAVRVLCTFTDGEAEWTIIAVHKNIIEASWRALRDGFIYRIMKTQ